MTGYLKILTLCFAVFGMNLAVVSDADARRLGGGGTFGKTSGAGRTASAPRSPSQQAAFKKNTQARQSMTQRGGFMGLLGGLAIGGLLGALFFGGAFESLNFLDIALFAGVAFLLFKLLSARKRAPGQMASGTGDAGFATQETNAPDLAEGSAQGGQVPEARGERPADFVEKDFLAGATRAFELLQSSWNDADLGEIRGLTTDAMFGHIQDQHRDGSVDAFVQVMNVNGKLLDVRQVGTTQEASVLFDAILRESEEDRPTQVREIWHFTRSAGALTKTWLLEGIEQLEG